MRSKRAAFVADTHASLVTPESSRHASIGATACAHACDRRGRKTPSRGAGHRVAFSYELHRIRIVAAAPAYPEIAALGGARHAPIAAHAFRSN
ncbi:hypothetical protein WS91_19035 [Burkholderia sp. MSMB1498]|nr:hypothetical protein WS91_19035 [Burkholderia sp. MSMB1498]